MTIWTKVIRMLLCAVVIPALVGIGCAHAVEPDSKVVPIVSVDVPLFLKLSNKRGCKLLSDLVDSSAGKDVVVSPAAATAAYLLVLNGLRGPLQSEMATTMGLSDSMNETIAQKSAEFLKSLNSVEPKSEAGVAIAAATGLTLKPDYVKLVRERFDGMAVEATAPGMEDLRAFLKKKTANRLGGDIEPPQPGSLRVLSSAYFKGAWAYKFLVDQTKPDTFYRQDGSTCKVQMMHKRFQHDLYYLRGSNFEAARLPYAAYEGTERTSLHGMYILLPDKGVRFADFLHELGAKGIDTYSSKWTWKTGDLALPRFKVHGRINLPLPDDGSGKPFLLDHADLSGMCQQSEPVASVAMQQELELAVNENGTEAAAITDCSLMFGGEPDVFDMRADRPFVFVIGDDRTGTILFAGAVVNPEDSKLPFEQSEQQWLDELSKAKQIWLKDKSRLRWYVSKFQEIAAFYWKEHKFDKAEIVLKEASILNKGTEGQASVLDDLAQLYVDRKRYNEASKLYQQLLPIQKLESKGVGDWLSEARAGNYMTYLNHYATLLVRMKVDPKAVYGEQERLYKKQVLDALRIYPPGKTKPQDKAHAAESIGMEQLALANFYARTKRMPDAEKLFKAAIATASGSPSPNFSLLYEAGKNYLKLLKDQNRAADAKNLSKEIEDWKRKGKIKNTAS